MNDKLRAPGADPALLDLVATDHYAISITTRCQQRCAFCFEGKHERARDVPEDQVEEQLTEAASKVPAVIFMGAEATLHPLFVSFVERASSRGLAVAVSTNLQRFADAAFLDRCVSAGLRRVELSFHYPDATVFQQITQTPARRFSRLLRALDNLEEVSRRDPRPPHDPGRFGVNVNVVLCSLNVERLDEVLNEVAKHVPTAFRLATFKRLETVTLAKTGGREQIDPRWIPRGDALRGGLRQTFEQWHRSETLPVMRDFPLCVSPGYEEHHLDLVFHGRKSSVLQNFGPAPSFSPMVDLATPAAPAVRAATSVRLPACERCSLVDLCHLVTGGKLALLTPGLDPLPSQRDPREILERAGLQQQPIDDLLARARRARPARTDRLTFELTPTKVEKLLRAAFARAGRRFDEPAIDSVQQEAHDTSGTTTTIVLSMGGERLVLWLATKQAGVRSFRAGKRFMITHAPDTPLRTPQQQDLARFVLAVCERFL